MCFLSLISSIFVLFGCFFCGTCGVIGRAIHHACAVTSSSNYSTSPRQTHCEKEILQFLPRSLSMPFVQGTRISVQGTTTRV